MKCDLFVMFHTFNQENKLQGEISKTGYIQYDQQVENNIWGVGD